MQLGNDGNDASAATPGVQLNAVIKSGGNTFRGDLYIDYENQHLQSNNVDDRLRNLGIGSGTKILKYVDPNISAGGPIKRDKMWYFTSWRDQQTATTVLGFPVEAPSEFSFPTELQNGTYKLTYQLNQKSRFRNASRSTTRHSSPRTGTGITVRSSTINSKKGASR